MKTGFTACLMLLLLSTVSLKAQDNPKQKRQKPWAINNVEKSLAKVDLSDEQKKQVAEIAEKYTPEYRALYKARVELLGADKLKELNGKRKDLSKEFKGKELQEATEKAIGLTAEQSASLKEIQKKTNQQTAAMKKEIAAVLTDAQKKAAGITPPAKKPGKKRDK